MQEGRLKTLFTILSSCALVTGSIHCSDRTLSVCEEFKGPIEQAFMAFEKGERQLAVDRYERVVVAASAEGCPFQEARAHNGACRVDLARGRLIASLSHIDEGMVALAESMSSGETRVERAGELRAVLEHNRGTAYLLLGLPDVALDRLELTRALYKQFNVTKKARVDTLLALSRVYRLRGDSEKAGETIRQALDSEPAPRARAALWQERARLALEAGDFRHASQSLDKAAVAGDELEDPHPLANVISDRAELAIRRQRWVEGLDQANQALQLIAETGESDLNLEAHANYLRSVALLRLGRLEEAKTAAERGLDGLRSVRDSWAVLNLEFLALRQSYISHRLDLAAVSGDAIDAWRVVEGNQARSLASVSVQGTNEQDEDEIDNSFVAEIAERRGELLEALAGLDHWDPATGPEVRDLSEALMRDRRLRKLRIEHQRDAVQSELISPISPQQASDLLGPETMALVFAAGSEQIHLLILDPQSSQHELDLLTLPGDRRSIEAMATELLAALGSRLPSRERELEDSVSRLSDALIRPVADRLDEDRRLVIVADGPLGRFPFEVLRNPRTHRRLIESHETVYSPSLSVLAMLRGRAAACPKAETQLMVIGDPIFSSNDGRWPVDTDDPRSPNEGLAFDRLEATADEAQSIARLYPGNALTLLGREATRDRVLDAAPRYQMIHIASHARSHSEVADLSKIALSCLGQEGPVTGSMRPVLGRRRFSPSVRPTRGFERLSDGGRSPCARGGCSWTPASIPICRCVSGRR